LFQEFTATIDICSPSASQCSLVDWHVQTNGISYAGGESPSLSESSFVNMRKTTMSIVIRQWPVGQSCVAVAFDI
jgi:hypothetical protein